MSIVTIALIVLMIHIFSKAATGIKSNIKMRIRIIQLADVEKHRSLAAASNVWYSNFQKIQWKYIYRIPGECQWILKYRLFKDNI